VVETTCVPLRGLAQLVFAERVDAGVLVLLAIALVSPWCALGSFLGSVFGSVAGRVLPIYTRTEWRLGLAGFNGAIIGILWGGFFASGAPRPLLFAAALTLCVLMEAVLRALLRPLSLPPLSMPAVLAAMLIDFVLAPPGTWFWMSAGAPPLGTGGIYAAIVCVVLAAATRHQAATLQALVLAAVAMWLATSVPGLAPPDSSGLWAFAVAPASFAAQALLAPGVLAGRLAGLAAAVLAAGIWYAWQLTGLAGLVQPLLLPYIAAAWMAALWLRRYGRTPWLEPDFWRACRALAHARRDGARVIALTGGRLGEPLGIPDFPSGSWRDPALPASAYSRERFAESLRCRRICWDACETLRGRARLHGPSPVHAALARLRRRRVIDAVLTTAVDGLQDDGEAAETVALFGDLNTVQCIDCGARQGWPPARVWHRWDLHCQACGGLLAPGVTFPGDALPVETERRARQLAAGCRVLLVIGHTRASTVDAGVVDRARRHGARIVFVNQGPVAHTLHAGDRVIAAPMAAVLGALARVLALVPDPGARPGTPGRARQPLDR
jgi:NAD-dependent deacetylase